MLRENKSYYEVQNLLDRDAGKRARMNQVLFLLGVTAVILAVIALTVIFLHGEIDKTTIIQVVDCTSEIVGNCIVK